jgi:hypothetical protein
MIAVDSTLIRKNFSAASFDRGSPLRRPASRNPGAETISSEMNSSRRSRDEDMVMQPRNEHSSRK